ncbi:MAG: SprT family zinc-dependent metalloprotease [Moheibacter sp.]
MTEKIQYGSKTISFELTYSKRKTLGITVHPDLSVSVKAPEDAQKAVIFQKVEKRAPWIMEQKRFFLAFEPRHPEYLYKSGESHYYLGRQYLLKIQKGKAEEVHYSGRFLKIETNNFSPEHIKKLLDKWYRERAKLKFAEYAEPLIQGFKKYNAEPNKLYIQQMKNRWGSCSAKGNIILNPELIKAPKACIEYVIVHELCHLIHRNHTKAFFALQSREMPDWEKWKLKLENFMA